jgi:hypothetical protein
VGPFAGAFLSSLILSAVAKRITVAKLYHFDSQQDALLRRASPDVKKSPEKPLNA